MNNLVIAIVLLLNLSACNTPTPQKAQLETIKEASVEKIAILEPVEKKAPTLKLEAITQTLSKHFDIQNTELKPASKRSQKYFHELLDATQIKSFKKLRDIYLIEYENATITAAEFGKLKAVAKQGLKQRKELRAYGQIFEKGGRSFNQVGKWIIVHDLRCNMYPKDYKIDRQFTTESEKLGFEVDWIRIYCGWGKLEIK